MFYLTELMSKGHTNTNLNGQIHWVLYVERIVAGFEKHGRDPTVLFVDIKTAGWNIKTSLRDLP